MIFRELPAAIRLSVVAALLSASGCLQPAVTTDDPTAGAAPAAAFASSAASEDPPACAPTPSPSPGPMTTAQVLPGNLGLFGWRGAIGDLDADGSVDGLLAAGGDWYPQVIQGYPWANGKFDVSRIWSTTDSSFNSQVRVADLTTSAGLEVIASTYQGPHLYIDPPAAGSFIRYYDDYAPGKVSSPRPLLCGVAVNDFELVDANYDGLLDLFVATTGIDLDGTDCAGVSGEAGAAGKAGADGDTSVARAVRDIRFLPPDELLDRSGTVEVSKDAANPLVWPFIGIYLNTGDAETPSFEASPSWWLAYPQEGSPLLGAADSPPGRPSRLAAMDFNQDGWLDYAAAFMSRSTVILYGGADLSALPAPGANLPFADDTAGVWSGEMSPAMSNDMFGYALQGAASDALSTFLAEARGCTPPETYCEGCGIPIGAPLGDGCSEPSSSCDACETTCDPHGELVVHQFPDETTIPVLDEQTRIVLAVGPMPALSEGDPDAPGLMFGIGNDPNASQLQWAPVKADAEEEVISLLSTPAFPIALLPFDSTPSTLSRTVTATAPVGGGGPMVTVPGLGMPLVTGVSLAGAALPPCGASSIATCWWWSPTARAVTIRPSGAAVGDVTVSFTAMETYDVLMVQPNPLVQSSLLTYSEQ